MDDQALIGDPSGMTANRLLGGRVVLRQPGGGYRVAIDPVLLAASVPAVAGDTVLDAGCGVGAAALCLAARVPGCRVLGVEIDRASADLARANGEANGCAARMDVHVGDVAAGLPPGMVPGSVDHAMANPPHLDPGRITVPPLGAGARVEGAASLAAWITLLLDAVRPRGSITVIHRADRLDEILAAFRGGAGGIVVFPLWPKAGRPSKRVIVQARKASRAAMALVPGLVLHEADGHYTRQADAVLREAAGLALAGPR